MPSNPLSLCEAKIDRMFTHVHERVDVQTITTEHLKYLICEHSVFSRQNIIFLEQAARGTTNIKPLSNELLRNLDEELGNDEEYGVHHFKLYRDSLQRETDIDLRVHQPSEATFAFIGKMLDLSSADTPEIVCGAVLAAEMAAVPELQLMRNIVERHCHQISQCEIDCDGGLAFFYEMHLSGVEQAHRDGLATFLSCHEDYGLDAELLVEGFDRAAVAMSVWWDQLSQQICQPSPN